jgi:lysophospholipase L1-like esterase
MMTIADTHKPAAACATDMPKRVMFFGDSRADWWELPDLPGVQCVARGFPGASSAYVLRQLRPTVASLHPRLIVVQVGVNDLIELMLGPQDQTRAVAATCQTITSLVHTAHDLELEVLLTTIFPLAHGPFPDQAVQSAICAANRQLRGLAGPQVTVFDSAAVLAEPDGYVCAAYADDELHLNAVGYAALNAALAPLLM